jgi:hypothetical protein
MSTRLLVLSCAVALAAAVWAQPPAVNYNGLIGGSDVIVLGGVTKATIPAVPANPPAGAPATENATITLKIEKALTGTIAVGSIDLTVPLRLGRAGGGGGAGAARTWTPNVAEGQSVIIGLVKTQAGLQVMAGMNGVVAGAQATAVADAIAAFTFKATLAAPANPLVIGDKAIFTVTVKNTGTTALSLAGATAAVLQAGATSPACITLTGVTDDTKNADGTAKTVAAGAEATIKVTATVTGPTDWQKLDAKVFPMAAQVAVTVTLAPVRAAGGPGGGGGMRGGFGLKTAWTDVKLAAPKAP